MQFSATLHENPSPQLRHIDTHAAISSRLLVGGLPSLLDPVSREQEIEKARTKRAQSSVYNLYVVFEGSTDIEFNLSAPTFESSGFNVCLDGFSNSTVADSFRRSIRDVLCALILAHSRLSIEKINCIGSVCFIVNNSNKPTYNLNPSLSAQVSVASPTSYEMIKDTVTLFSAMPDYTEISRLVVNSLESKASALQSFICSWAALEIFVNISRPGRRSLQEKFASIAQEFDPLKANSDEKEFVRLKGFRNGYFHNGRPREEGFPTASIHNLLMKYLTLRISNGGVRSDGD